MITIDLNRLREALPDRANVFLRKQDSVPFLDIHVYPSLSDEDFEMCKNWQLEIIGKENIMEFYTQEEGRHWYVYFKRQPIEFINVSNNDVNSYTSMNIVE